MWFSRLTDLTCEKPHSEDGVWTAVGSGRLWESFSPLVLKPAGAECEEQQVHGIADTQAACLEGTIGQKLQCQKYTKKNQLSKVLFLLAVGRCIYNFVSPDVSYVFK